MFREGGGGNMTGETGPLKYFTNARTNSELSFNLNVYVTNDSLLQFLIQCRIQKGGGGGKVMRGRNPLTPLNFKN